MIVPGYLTNHSAELMTSRVYQNEITAQPGYVLSTVEGLDLYPE